MFNRPDEPLIACLAVSSRVLLVFVLFSLCLEIPRLASFFQPDGGVQTSARGLNLIELKREPSFLLRTPTALRSLTGVHPARTVSKTLSLLLLTRDLELYDESLRFLSPLAGDGGEQQDAANRRTVFFESLKPRTDRLRHIPGDRPQGKPRPDLLSFPVNEPWYQTRKSYVGACAVILLIAGIIHRLRVAHLARTFQARFEERLGERTRMAREMHDTFLQTVQGSKMVADDALAEGTDETRRMALIKLSGWLGQAITDARSALQTMLSSAPEHNPFAESLRRAAKDLPVPSGMSVECLVTGEQRDLHPLVRNELWQIGFEAIRNSAQHSQATHLQIALHYSSEFVLKIKDDGVGMSEVVAAAGRPGHFGLAGMRERSHRIHGRLSVTSDPGHGTEVSVVIPGSVAHQGPEQNSILERLRRLFGMSRGRHEE
jgi:signal transduction histidine kinase